MSHMSVIYEGFLSAMLERLVTAMHQAMIASIPDILFCNFLQAVERKGRGCSSGCTCRSPKEGVLVAHFALPVAWVSVQHLRPEVKLKLRTPVPEEGQGVSAERSWVCRRAP